MAYRKEYPQLRKKRDIPWGPLLAAGGLLLCLLTGQRSRPGSWRAAEVMAAQIRQGEPVVEALQSFCLELIRDVS